MCVLSVLFCIAIAACLAHSKIRLLLFCAMESASCNETAKKNPSITLTTAKERLRTMSILMLSHLSHRQPMIIPVLWFCRMESAVYSATLERAPNS